MCFPLHLHWIHSTNSLYSLGGDVVISFQSGECAKDVAQRIQDPTMICTYNKVLESKIIDPGTILDADTYYVAYPLGFEEYTFGLNVLKWWIVHGHEISKDTFIDACRFGKKKVVQYLVNHGCPIE